MRIERLNTVSSDVMRPLLEEERHYLMRHFLWDTQYSFKLKLQLLKYGRIDGLAAFEQDKPIGYIYWHNFQTELYLSGYYFSSKSDYQNILDFLSYAAEFIKTKYSAAVIEGQLLCIDDKKLSEIFENEGYVTVERNYMSVDFSKAKFDSHSKLPEGLRIRNLSDLGFDMIDEIADSMKKSYIGTLDEWITRSFGSFQGCRNFISNLFEFPVYGRLEADLSFVIADDSDSIIGMIFICKASNTTSHLVQVSVIPDYQRRGIGRFMVEECVKRLKREKFKNAVLMVTSGNVKAINLYKKYGFETVTKFYSINFNKIK